MVSRNGSSFGIIGNNGQVLGDQYDYVILAVPFHQEQNIKIEGCFYRFYSGVLHCSLCGTRAFQRVIITPKEKRAMLITISRRKISCLPFLSRC